jgi:hypothetical protein
VINKTDRTFLPKKTKQALHNSGAISKTKPVGHPRRILVIPSSSLKVRTWGRIGMENPL